MSCRSAAAMSKKITHRAPAATIGPLYSPDGKYLAFRSQFSAGYESDRWRLMVLERATGKTTNLTEHHRPLGGQLHLVARFHAALLHRGGSRPHRPANDSALPAAASRSIISGASTLDDVQFTSDGRTMIYTEESGSRPIEIFRATSGGGTGVALTHLNDALLAGTHAHAAGRNVGGQRR